MRLFDLAPASCSCSCCFRSLFIPLTLTPSIHPPPLPSLLGVTGRDRRGVCTPERVPSTLRSVIVLITETPRRCHFPPLRCLLRGLDVRVSRSLFPSFFLVTSTGSLRVVLPVEEQQGEEEDGD